MANINSLFPGKYLAASELEQGDVVMMIRELKIETIDGTEQKPVLFFQNFDRGMVLNKTNAMRVAALYGEDYDQWSGQPVTLTTEATKTPNGTPCRGLRIAERAPQGMPQQSPPPLPPQQQPPAPQQMPQSQQWPQQAGFPQQQQPAQQPPQWGQQPPPPPPGNGYGFPQQTQQFNGGYGQ